MSISIDDLVSSLSASHVSQEAMDIATLQVIPPSSSLPLNLVNPEKCIQSQLSQVIYYPSQSQSGVHCVTRRNSYAQPCNTPTPTSATASFHWEWDDATRYRGQNPAPYVAPPPLHDCDVDDEMQDEQTVEDLLNAHTPNQCLFDAPLAQRQQPQKYRPVSSGQPFPMPPPPPPPPTYDNIPGLSGSPSHFANTDPFYLAASQTAPAPSFFAQAARPAPNSPFNLNLSAQQAHHVLEVESRTVLVGAGQSR
ncbi:hypothetical protein BGW80DRAFT_1249706 [Lactifluus volemus]|nr:hypothetical protein BGW80DRAFT_1249706 [Lactifluus volemus]